MKDQFWGTFYVFGIAMATARMNNSRFIIYAICLVFGFINYGPRMVFLAGLVLADMDQCGIFERFKKINPLYAISVQILLACAVFAVWVGNDSW